MSNMAKATKSFVTCCRATWGKNHAVFFDNFFSSVNLAEDLLAEKTTCYGTIRPNRKGWPLPNNKKQKPGEVKMKQKGQLVAVQWTDK